MMLLFFTLFMALGMSFKRQKSGNTLGYVSVGQSAVPDVLPELFVYICLCLIFCHRKKKKIPEKENILIVSGGKINAVHQTAALKFQGSLENELEAELIQTLEERSNIHEFCWLQLLLQKLKDSDRFMAKCGGTTGNGLRRLCRALISCKEPWGSRRSP